MSTVSVGAADLARVAPSVFATGVFAAATNVARSADEGAATPAVMVTEVQELDVTTGSFNLDGGDVSQLAAFLSQVRDAACASISAGTGASWHMRGTCSVAFADAASGGVRRQLGLGSGGAEPTPHAQQPPYARPHARRLGSRRLKVTRSYDARATSAAGADVAQLISSSLSDKGVAVTAARITSLSAEVTVTASAASLPRLSENAMKDELSQTLPMVSLDISTAVIGPPSQPPHPPPSPPSYTGPPSPPPPSPPPPVHKWSSELIVAFSLVATIVAGAIFFLVFRRRYFTEQEKEPPEDVPPKVAATRAHLDSVVPTRVRVEPIRGSPRTMLQFHPPAPASWEHDPHDTSGGSSEPAPDAAPATRDDPIDVFSMERLPPTLQVEDISSLPISETVRSPEGGMAMQTRVALQPLRRRPPLGPVPRLLSGPPRVLPNAGQVPNNTFGVVPGSSEERRERDTE